ncbi:sigma-70 family RNA polymerase sigma factor [Amycolatopsis regifaucium]|uniref:RNA polymerase subunit sigma-70 n=1 Tax=Amycolatopsis regifaucium TaxID=546365 RepID=A0A154MI19_9PSEU|nr:sigma-70 family RNA polymerase sigma factor [Amycolatopsis regifaucium]KZB83783.1 RNA polymerase subunit sigma-70 [Amycolatopsis regifaucium]OKA06776.1 RNA polymerase subunit sigma-70 [Amycolatopsis regifaucium]SFH26519.1 RNA polymerase sigma-70 factor, ECF subfamily [Amycolatopsis regifaucium]
MTVSEAVRPTYSPRPGEPDGALIRAAISGDRPAIGSLLSLLRPIVFRYCVGKLGVTTRGVSSADDCAQEVLMAVLVALPRYSYQNDSFLPYVFGIAAHKVADVRRNLARDPSAPVPDPEPEQHGPWNPTFEEVEKADRGRRLARLFKVLTPKQRDVLVFRVILGFSAEETAAALGVASAGAVRVTQHRALNELRRVLRQNPGFADGLALF